MASAAVATAIAMGDQPNVHPFFAKSQRPHSPEHGNEVETSQDDPLASTNAAAQDEDRNTTEETQAPRPRGRPLESRMRNAKRKSGGIQPAKKVKQTSLSHFTKDGNVRTAEKEMEATTNGEAGGTSLDEDPNISRRKRQRTASLEADRPVTDAAVKGTGSMVQPREDAASEEPLSWVEQLEREASKSNEEAVSNTPPGQAVLDQELRQTTALPSSPPVMPPSPAEGRSSPKNKNNAVVISSSPEKSTPPKKMLRLNARGRFSSPVSKAAIEEPIDAGKQRKTRGKSNKKQPKELIVKMAYLKDDEKSVSVAEKIDQILAGIKRVPPVKPQEHPKQREQSKPTGPPKPTHPFFTGKLGRHGKEEETKSSETSNVPAPPSPSKPVSRRETAITPGKLRAQMRGTHDYADFPSFGMNANSAKPRKHVGSADAPWPWKGLAHVRGDLENSSSMDYTVAYPSSETFFKGRRKFKNNVYAISDNESLMSLFARDLFHNPKIDTSHTELLHDVRQRFPERLLTTGPDLQCVVRPQIRAFVPSNLSSSPGVHAEDHCVSSQKTVHPTLTSLFDAIKDTLTPFDRGVCETLPWIQKYAPKRAVDVLGSAKEVNVLRNWLESLRITAVEGGSKEVAKAAKKKAGTTKPPKKKRKKSDDLDDFLVSDEDDMGELDELTDPDDSPPTGLSHGPKKSMIREGMNGGAKKLHNLILLSGPHGVGKTAAVYAVAKELGFEVFELNSGSRRSGKDVFDKIGDMTENHLVQRRSQETVEQPPTDSDAERLSDAVQKDIESGRQKSMSLFFKPMIQAKPKAKSAAKEPKPKPAEEALQPTLGKPKQSQKQSLILLEEVDVLFEDDKNFWQTVEHLALHSKRPIVMTCTDESLVRMSESSLHAILRLTPALRDLATDYMLLLAAKEGHLIRRDAVASLYESKNFDLRASIMELDFWCQMAVGDRKGGLEWMYQRWPPGKDVDGHGRTLRVASKDTYHTGMGWVGHDVLSEQSHVGFDREHELLLELTESWHLETEACTLGSASAGHDDQEGSDRQYNLMALQDMERLMEMSSAADVYCRVGVPTRSKTLMDPTQPQMPKKARANFTDGYPLIQADAINDFISLDTHLAVSSLLTASRSVQASRSLQSLRAQPQAAIPCLTESGVTTSILAHLSNMRQSQHLSRTDFFVFDAVAEAPNAFLNYSSNSPGTMTASSFDRNFHIIVTELAPYVRSIAAYDLRLETERMRISNMLSAGGQGKPKRIRTTRAARSALEGGRREKTRRERWFDKNLNLALVMRTAGREWTGLGARGLGGVEGEKDSETETASHRSPSVETE